MERPMVIDNWYGYTIRFVQMDDGEWWAVLKDLCDALGLNTWDVSQRLYPDDLDKTTIDQYNDTDLDGIGVCDSYRGRRNPQRMTIVTEQGVIDMLMDSRKLEARKLRRWVIEKLRNIRQFVGLQQYQVLHLTEKCYLDDFDMFWDDEAEKWRKTHMLPNGDVEVED